MAVIRPAAAKPRCSSHFPSPPPHSPPRNRTHPTLLPTHSKFLQPSPQAPALILKVCEGSSFATIYIRLHYADYKDQKKSHSFLNRRSNGKISFAWCLNAHKILRVDPILVVSGGLICGGSRAQQLWLTTRTKHLVECGRFGQVAACSQSCCCSPGCTTAHNLQSGNRSIPV